MRNELKEMSQDLKENKRNIQEMSQKINAIEQRQKDSDSKTVEEISSIRTEIRENNTKMQETIQNNILSQIKPEMAQMQEELVRTDIHKIVEEVLLKKNFVTHQEA